jgi:hypothetical protein
MIWLYSHNEYDYLGRFDPNTGHLKKTSLKGLGSEAPDITEFAGSFPEVKGGLFVLYRHRGQVIFWAFGNEFVLDGQTIVDVDGSGRNRCLSIKTMGKSVSELEYELLNDGPIPGDLTPFIDDEDFDFGLFVSNISKDQDRREVLLGND